MGAAAESPDMSQTATSLESQLDKTFQEEDTQKDKYLTFFLADEEYGIPICNITEIIGIQKITKVPDMPQFVKGVINLRGKIIPVMDVRLRFGLPQREYEERTCVIVIEVGEEVIGLVVDRVREVADIPEAAVEPAPANGRGTSERYIQGIGKAGDTVKILLDVEQLLAA